MWKNLEKRGNFLAMIFFPKIILTEFCAEITKFKFNVSRFSCAKNSRNFPFLYAPTSLTATKNSRYLFNSQRFLDGLQSVCLLNNSIIHPGRNKYADILDCLPGLVKRQGIDGPLLSKFNE
jgi:hypothetical protein